MIWPRGGQLLRLSHSLHWPQAWGERSRRNHPPALRWWAEAAECRINGNSSTKAISLTPPAAGHCQNGLALERLELELLLQARATTMALCCWRSWSANHRASDPDGLLLSHQLRLLQHDLPSGDNNELWPAAGGSQRQGCGRQAAPLAEAAAAPAGLTLLSHAHLDLAWLWPVADTWQAAERTFRSVLGLMQRAPELHFGHSTPALYAWLQQHRPALFAEISRRCSRAAGSR